MGRSVKEPPESLARVFHEAAKRNPALTRLAVAGLQHARAWQQFDHFNPVSGVVADWIDFTIQSAEAAGDKSKRGDRYDELMLYAVNASRWASHLWSVWNSLQGGAYGECFAVARLALELTDLMVLLASEPAQVTDWIDATSTVDRPVPSHWRPGQIRARLTAAKANSYDSALYARVSAAIHPSAWGNSLYLSRTPRTGNEFQLTFAARFDPRRAGEILSLVLRVLPLPVWQFLRIAERRELPAKIQQSFRSRYEVKSAAWIVTMKYLHGLDKIVRDVEEQAGSGPIDQAILDRRVSELLERISNDESLLGGEPAAQE
jgi:hypothetical protein